jgi:hypothetical protein
MNAQSTADLANELAMRARRDHACAIAAEALHDDVSRIANDPRNDPRARRAAERAWRRFCAAMDAA